MPMFFGRERWPGRHVVGEAAYDAAPKRLTRGLDLRTVTDRVCRAVSLPLADSVDLIAEIGRLDIAPGEGVC